MPSVLFSGTASSNSVCGQRPEVDCQAVKLLTYPLALVYSAAEIQARLDQPPELNSELLSHSVRILNLFLKCNLFLLNCKRVGCSLPVVLSLSFFVH